VEWSPRRTSGGQKGFSSTGSAPVYERFLRTIVHLRDLDYNRPVTAVLCVKYFNITLFSISLLTKHFICSFSLYCTSVKATSFFANSTSINIRVIWLYIPLQISITGQSMVF